MIVDTSEVTAFAAKLQATPERKQRKITMIVKKAAQNVKTDTRADLQSSSNRGIRRVQIAYEMKREGVVVEADVAPIDTGATKKKSTPPSVAAIAFFGTARGGGTHDFYKHARREFPNLVRELRRAAMGL